MKFIHPNPKMLGFAPDFIQRGKPVVNIERRILQPLCHDWAGALLKFQDEMGMLLARLVIEIFGKTKHENIAEKMEDRFFERRVSSFRRGDGAFDDGAVLIADRVAGVDISSINRKTGNGFADRTSECLAACDRALALGDDAEVRDLRARVVAAAPREIEAAA